MWKLRDLLKNIVFWFRVNWNREHFKVVWEAIKGHPWDYCFYTELEIAKLNEMIEYHKKSGIVEESERKWMISWMTKAKRMLEIIRDPLELVEYEGNLLELNGDSLKRNLKVYVNTKNIDRFTKSKIDYENIEKEKDFLNRFPEELYVRKAKNIYTEIWKRYLETWWD